MTPRQFQYEVIQAAYLDALKAAERQVRAEWGPRLRAAEDAVVEEAEAIRAAEDQLAMRAGA